MAVYDQPDTPFIGLEPLPTQETLTEVPVDPVAAIRPAGELLAHWSFDGEEGLDVSDLSGNENVAVLARPEMRSPDVGWSGHAVAYQNTDDVLSPAEETSLHTQLAAPFLQRTVALWVNAAEATTPQILYEEGGDRDGLALRLRDGFLEARVVTVVNDETLASQVVYPFPATGEWQHVAAAFNRGVLVLFLNGEPVAFVDIVPFAVVSAHPDPAAIGNTSGSNAFADGDANTAFSGLIDDVILFGKEFIEPLPVETATPTVTISPSPAATAGATLAITETPSPTTTQTPLPTTTQTPSPTTFATSSPTVTALPSLTATSPATPAPQVGTATPFPTATVPAPTAAATAPAGAIQGLPIFELPFPYDGRNEAFGGNPSLFRSASQGPSNGGRINSYYDHLYPLYPAPQAGNVTNGREPVEQPFGGQMLPFDGLLRETVYSGHPGFDFAPFERGRSTTPLFAAADGVIHEAAIHADSGAYYIEILHRTESHGDFLTRYWHLEPDEFFEATRERVGQPITAGERIGTIGNTGWSTGHHLHFEVRYDRNEDGVFALNETIDPFGFIPSAAYPEDPWQVSGTFVDGKGQTYSHPGSQSYYLWKHPLGRSAQIAATGGGKVVQYDGVGGEGGAELCAPNNALPPGSTINWSWVPDPPPAPELVGTGHGCALSAIAPDGSQITRFDAPVRVVVPFDVEDLRNIENPAETLAIYWQRPGSSTYERLDTVIDLAAGLASAETEYPGVCTLAGLPNRDLVAPQTSIDVVGPSAGNDVFTGPVSVSLSSADEDVAFTHYSVDGGNTWQPYTGAFPIPGDAKSMGAPDPLLEGEGVEGLVRGPGRYLVLAASRDESGNEEYPPAARIIYIEPIIPTVTAMPDAVVCDLLFASAVRQSTTTNSPILLSFAAGERLPIEGRTAPSDWYQVRLPDGRLGWVGASRCAPVSASVPVVTPPQVIGPAPAPTVTAASSDEAAGGSTTPSGNSVVQDVWDCEYTGNGAFTWYSVEIFYDAAGNPIREEQIGGPFTGPWQSGCAPGPRIWVDGCTVHWELTDVVTEAFLRFEETSYYGYLINSEEFPVTVPNGSYDYEQLGGYVEKAQFFMRLTLTNGNPDTIKAVLDQINDPRACYVSTIDKSGDNPDAGLGSFLQPISLLVVGSLAGLAAMAIGDKAKKKSQ
jgi:murein DD-endopeptidase MepM/ murein hydrolase activator NlpD